MATDKTVTISTTVLRDSPDITDAPTDWFKNGLLTFNPET